MEQWWKCSRPVCTANLERFGSLASCAGGSLGTTGFCAILRSTGENKIHSIELALLHARGKYLIANALTYFQRATTYHARYATYSYVEKQRSALRYFVIRLTNWLNVGMRQGSRVLGWAATFDARTTEACPMSSGRIHLPRLLEDADGSRASDFPTGKRHLSPTIFGQLHEV